MRAWNWKSALHSGLYRAIPFFAAVRASGGSGAGEGAAVQFVLFAVLAGFTGALVQRLRHFRPGWAALAILLAVWPLCVHAAEWWLHEALAPGMRRAGIFVSWGQSALSMATQWALMRKGLFLSGPEARSYPDDWLALLRMAKRLLRRVPGR
ncbi:MAG: hypothetical protein N2036_12510 [Bryobacteraceae bacterium]|nr:hypothetical protein [Bryobacteraceae bacterium]